MGPSCGRRSTRPGRADQWSREVRGKAAVVTPGPSRYRPPRSVQVVVNDEVRRNRWWLRHERMHERELEQERDRNRYRDNYRD